MGRFRKIFGYQLTKSYIGICESSKIRGHLGLDRLGVIVRLGKLAPVKRNYSNK